MTQLIANVLIVLLAYSLYVAAILGTIWLLKRSKRRALQEDSHRDLNPPFKRVSYTPRRLRTNIWPESKIFGREN